MGFRNVPCHFPLASLSVLLTGDLAVGEGRARSDWEGLCLWLSHSLSPALGLIVPRTQTHPVGLVRRSDGNPPFQVSGLSNGPGGLGRALNRSWQCPSDYLARGGRDGPTQAHRPGLEVGQGAKRWGVEGKCPGVIIRVLPSCGAIGSCRAPVSI